MDPFWGITLSVIAISSFWKSEKRKSAERRYDKARREEKAIAEASRPIPLSEEEKEAKRIQKEIDKQRERDIQDLRKQGFSEELITTILPTINNGQ